MGLYMLVESVGGGRLRRLSFSCQENAVSLERHLVVRRGGSSSKQHSRIRPGNAFGWEMIRRAIGSWRFSKGSESTRH